MKVAIIEYLVRLSVIWGVLLLYYQVLLVRNHNWRLRRAYLLFTYLLGICIPLLPAIAWSQVPAALPHLQIGSTFPIKAPVAAPAVEATAGFSWWLLVPLIYVAGIGLQLVFILKNTWQIQRWKTMGSSSGFGPYTIVEHEAISSPFACWRTIFLPTSLDSKLQFVACLHEAAHLRSYHNQERLPLIIGQLFFWFHPLQWYYSYCLRTVQEFQADEAVLQHIPTKTYGHMLIQQSMQPTHTWQAGLFASPLKQRINMMVKKKKSQPWHWSQLSLFVGLLGMLVMSCSDLIGTTQPDYEDVISYVEADQAPVLVTSDDPTPSKNPINRALLENIYRNIKYPANARQNGVEGLVVARFIIDEEGKLEPLTFNTRDGQFVLDKSGKLTPSTLRRPDYKLPTEQEEIVVVGYGGAKENGTTGGVDMGILAKEVDRILRELPDWKPAIKDGKPVSVAMQIGVKFKLE